MADNKIPIDQIARLADDVRLIKDFAENHNFDSSLLTANVSPSSESESKADSALYSMIGSIVLLLVSIAVIKFWSPPLSSVAISFIFIVGLVFATLASVAAHRKFQDNIVTGIVVIGVFMVLFIGTGIFTPEQAVDKVGELAN